MGITYFEKGKKVFIDEVGYEILREFDGHMLQLEQINTGKLKNISKDDMLEKFQHGKLTFFRKMEPNENRNNANTSSGQKALDQFSEEVQQKTKIKYAYLLALRDNPPGVYTRKSMTAIIQVAWKKLGKPGKMPHWSTVNRWRKRYESFGSDIRALINQEHKKGNYKRRYPVAVIEAVQQSVEEIYLTRERFSIEDTLDNAIDRIRRENNRLPDTVQLPLPTRRLVSAAINQIPAYDKCVSRYGKQAAIRRFRSVLGKAVTERILQRVEIDHTQLDLFVVDDEDMLPLGRPWFTACIDANSRSILGIQIGFEPPAHLSVAECLRHAFLPKKDLHTSYPSIKNDWHSYGVMETLVVDNGLEFHSNNLESVCFSFGINILFTPRKTPWFKGMIERFFFSLTNGVTQGIPGRTFHNILEKDDYDVAKTATVAYSTLKEIINLWIVDYYHQKVHRSLGTTPQQAWIESEKSHQIAVPDNIDDLNAMLGRVTQRTLTHVGIEIFSMKYNNRELGLLRNQLGEKLKVDVRYSEANIGHIYVIHPENDEPIRVECVNRDYTEGLSLWQHNVIRRFAKRYLKRRKDIEALAEAKEKIRGLVMRDIFNKKAKSKSRVKAERFLSVNKKASKSMGSENKKYGCDVLTDKPIYESTEQPFEISEDSRGFEMQSNTSVRKALRVEKNTRAFEDKTITNEWEG